MDKFLNRQADLLTQSSSIMDYSRWLRRLVLVTLPISLPLIILWQCLVGGLLHGFSLVEDILVELHFSGVSYLWADKSLREQVRGW